MRNSGEIKIDKAIDKEGLLIGVRMKVCSENENGKESITIIKPIKYNKEKDLTLIEAIPLTGRQHQIRADFFWGFGPEALNYAGRMKEKGKLYVLKPKY